MSRRPSKLEHYRDEEVAASYDRRWASAAGARRDARKAAALQRALGILEEHAGKRAQTLLDLPCGTGRFTDLWEEGGRSLLSVDLSLEMLQQAQRKHPQASLLAADALRLPFADRSFDVVYCIRFFHLIRDPELRVAMLREIRRVSRIGAILDYRHSRTVRIWGRHLRHRLGLRAGPPANPSPSRIRAELQRAGWQPLAWLPVHRAPLLSDKVLLPAIPQAEA